MSFKESLIYSGFDGCEIGEMPTINLINQKKFDSLLHNTIRKIIIEDNQKIAQFLIRSKIKVEIESKLKEVFKFLIQICLQQEYFEQLSEEDKNLIINKMSSIINNLSKSEIGEMKNWEIELKTELINPENNWREELERELSLKRSITNQGAINNSDNIIFYNYLKYRSPAEVEITKELSKWDILYFPLPVSVIKGKKREPDFLIQHPETKKFGILEINGDTYHTPTNSQQDHERAEIFFSKGIFVKFVSAKKCLEKPKDVIKQFFEELKNF